VNTDDRHHNGQLKTRYVLPFWLAGWFVGYIVPHPYGIGAAFTILVLSIILVATSLAITRRPVITLNTPAGVFRIRADAWHAARQKEGL
jgi:hypothetical protein